MHPRRRIGNLVRELDEAKNRDFWSQFKQTTTSPSCRPTSSAVWEASGKPWLDNISESDLAYQAIAARKEPVGVPATSVAIDRLMGRPTRPENRSTGSWTGRTETASKIPPSWEAGRWEARRLVDQVGSLHARRPCSRACHGGPSRKVSHGLCHRDIGAGRGAATPALSLALADVDGVVRRQAARARGNRSGSRVRNCRAAGSNA